MKKAVSKVVSVASVVALLVGLGVFFTSALNSPHIASESSLDATNNCNESQNTTRVNLGENPRNQFRYWLQLQNRRWRALNLKKYRLLKAQKSQTSGYQVQYSTSKSFKSAKTETVGSNKTTAKTIKSLKGGKKYYVRVRTYKKVGPKKYYSSWSGSKTAKTKR